MPRRQVVAVLAAAVLAAALPLAPAAAQQTPGEAQACRAQGVVMFSTSWCGFCRKARRFFEDNDVAFEEIDAEASPSDAIRQTAKRNGVPYIIVGSEIVRGFNERRLRHLLCIPS